MYSAVPKASLQAKGNYFVRSVPLNLPGELERTCLHAWQVFSFFIIDLYGEG
jgi:hypothetical protein